MSKTAPRRNGRPLHPIAADTVYKLARLGCTNDEIAAWFDCSPATVASRFQAQLTTGRAGLKVSLRRAQIKSALEGSTAMLIHLGRHFLGQGDKAAVDREWAFSGVTLSHQDAPATELEGPDSADAAARGFRPRHITIEYIDGPAGSLAVDRRPRSESTEGDAADGRGR